MGAEAGGAQVVDDVVAAGADGCGCIPLFAAVRFEVQCGLPEPEVQPLANTALPSPTLFRGYSAARTRSRVALRRPSEPTQGWDQVPEADEPER